MTVLLFWLQSVLIKSWLINTQDKYWAVYMYLPGQLQTLCTNTNLVSGSQGTRLPTLPLDQFLQSVPRSLKLATLDTFTLYRYHQLHKYGTDLTW